ncbi:Phosphatidylinositol-3-phosphatase SAC1 [Paecilomyces lecythidis]|uniref:Phosphatidylinositol-3-phosphatase SAC1 n=1 Tax=Paecilomyces lecythidis TaxID=3004212 RepID=A0ABR3XA46_9EURO
MIANSTKRVTVEVWTLADSYSFIASFARRRASASPRNGSQNTRRRHFHDYFVTHLPSSSLHPDSRAPHPSFHKLPRAASLPHTGGISQPPAVLQPLVGRETTVVRIPLRSAKHHFGASFSRGSRPYNEDTYQAGVIEVPAFAKRVPRSLTIRRRNPDGSPAPPLNENRGAESASGDPQVFYFAIFDGHGGSECSEFLRDSLHTYIEDTAEDFELQSSLRKRDDAASSEVQDEQYEDAPESDAELPIMQHGNRRRIGELERNLLDEWKYLVGGYFRRFRPVHFTCYGEDDRGSRATNSAPASGDDTKNGVSIEEVMEYAFLRADLDFVSAQASKRDADPVREDKPLNEDEILEKPSRTRTRQIGGRERFKGGSTCSVAMISTPTPTPFWHPSAPSSLLISHVGDTRILLCSTASGEAIPVTSVHHPSSPIEGSRLRRYAASFVTDSFGEERMSGLANTRAFGDIQSKRIGVSAEPEIRRIEMGPAEYSFLVLMSDGVSDALSDQEVADIIKEAKTPEQGSKDVVNFATEVSNVGDNATCLVIRLGGWERRLEGGLGSMGTKESRDWRRQEATDPRRSRT